LKILEDYKNLADFIKRVEQAKYFIVFFVRNPTPGKTLYILRGYKSYLSRSIYIEHSYNLQPFQRHDDKTYDVHFLFYIYKKDVDNKDKGIDRINQNKF